MRDRHAIGFGPRRLWLARTPLLRAFQRLAEEHRTSARLGIVPEELRQRRREAAYSRRDFLKRAGVAGAAVAVAGPAAFARPASANRQQRIAIVGAGIAGLSAALWSSIRPVGVELSHVVG